MTTHVGKGNSALAPLTDHHVWHQHPTLLSRRLRTYDSDEAVNLAHRVLRGCQPCSQAMSFLPWHLLIGQAGWEPLTELLGWCTNWSCHSNCGGGVWGEEERRHLGGTGAKSNAGQLSCQSIVQHSGLNAGFWLCIQH